jgi:hypothetical protein
MKKCFYGCKSLTTAPVIPNGVNDMGGAFQGCTALTTVPNIPSACANYNSTFYGCTSLVTVPSDGWKGNMGSTFNQCNKLNCQINIESATNLHYTFYKCYALTYTPSLPSEATNLEMVSCFQYCSSLVTPPTIPNGVTRMTSCFQGCTSLTTAPNIPLSTKGQLLDALMRDCTSITSVTIPLEVLTNSYWRMLYGCTALTNVDWIGLTTTGIDVGALTGNDSRVLFTQADIQELVPEHLADLYKDKIKISFSNKTITINDTDTTWE